MCLKTECTKDEPTIKSKYLMSHSMISSKQNIAGRNIDQWLKFFPFFLSLLSCFSHSFRLLNNDIYNPLFALQAGYPDSCIL